MTSTPVIVTDHEKRQHAFYKALGFTDVSDTALHSFVGFGRPDSTRWDSPMGGTDT